MELLPKLQSMLQEQFGLTAEQLQPDKTLADLGIESLSIIEFMFDVENEFGIEFSQEGDPPRTVGDLLALVTEAIAKKKVAATS